MQASACRCRGLGGCQRGLLCRLDLLECARGAAQGLKATIYMIFLHILPQATIVLQALQRLKQALACRIWEGLLPEKTFAREDLLCRLALHEYARGAAQGLKSYQLPD